MVKALVHYKQWVDSGSVHFDATLEDRSKIVEVKDVLELNNLFRHITKVDVINNLSTPLISSCCSLELKKELEKRGAVVVLKEDREVGNYS